MENSDISVIILADDKYEDLELWYPYLRLKEERFDVKVAAAAGVVQCESKHGYPVKPDAGIAELVPENLNALIIPGGYAPDLMRRNPKMVKLVSDVYKAGGLVAIICHAGSMAISADILRGKKATSFVAIKDDMINAGADWVDEEVVRDGQLISSRSPEDLPAFCATIIGALKEERGE